jgi:pyruvate/2-oxoglutarate dehydrogenase complex dihydrolipoamide dehydrogenase (E3) component
VLLRHSRCRIVKHAEDHYTVSFKAPDGPEQTMEVGLVMMATGRSPRTQGLGLEVSLLSPVTTVESTCWWSLTDLLLA